MATLKQHIPKVFLLLLVVVLLYNAIFSLSFTNGTNWRNVSVDTIVNITNANPEILEVTIDDPITLAAGGLKYVECNATIRDYNGFDDINRTNATFYRSNYSGDTPDNLQYHYTNSSCTASSESGNIANYTCGFYLAHYAQNGSWTCNVTTSDQANKTGNLTNTTTVNELLALNVSSPIDYGNLSIGDTSANQTANVSNIGNVPINVSVRGFGGNVYGLGINLSFICDQGNISIEYERYSISQADAYAAKTPLNDSFAPLGLTVQNQVDTTPRWNLTYWQLQVPPNPFGICNGTVVFQAETSA